MFLKMCQISYMYQRTSLTVLYITEVSKTLEPGPLCTSSIRVFDWLRAMCASFSIHFRLEFELFIDSRISDTPVKI
jgi:hypothetical protein